MQKNVCEIIGRTSERARLRRCHPDTPGARTAFFDQHKTLFRISAAILVRHWTKRDYTAPCWRSKTGIARDEKFGRQAQIQSDLDKSQLTYFGATDLALEELICGRHRVEEVLRCPKTRSTSRFLESEYGERYDVGPKRAAAADH